MNKEHNFISAVIFAEKASKETFEFLNALSSTLEDHFLQYEIILVRVADESGSFDQLKEWASGISKPVTVVNMSAGQPHEQCMNAGLDITIGDYVYEFDSAILTYPKEIIFEAYELAMKGNDIINVCPKQEKRRSRVFYAIFNRHSDFTYKLRTNAFRLVSRRALNRVHAINENLPYRKAAYAASGLKLAELEYTSLTGKLPTKAKNPATLALDSLILYTNFGYRFGLGFSLLMFFGTITMGIYVFATYLLGNPIDGWTTTMLALTAGLTGIFGILTIVLKYMTLILRLLFQKQKYLVESIEKL